VSFLTLKDVAKKLGVSVPSVRRYIKRGALGAVRFGRDYKVTEEALSSFTDKKQVTSQEPQKEENKSLSKKEDKHKNHKHHKKPVIFQGINSHILEAISEMSRDIKTIDDIKSIIKDHANECYGLLNQIEKEGVHDTHTAINLLLIDEAIKNLQLRREIFRELITNKAIILLPIPPHLSDAFLGVTSVDMVYSADGEMPPHLKHAHYPHIKYEILLRNKNKFDGVEALVIEGYYEKNEVFVREDAANFIYFLNHPLKKIYIHSIPHIPPHSRFVKLDPEYASISVSYI